MRSLTRFLALCVLTAFLCLPVPGQAVRAPRDSVRNSRPDSAKAVIMTVDSTKIKNGTHATREEGAGKPRSSTVRTIERQTAPHAAKNAPRVKNTKPTTR